MADPSTYRDTGDDTGTPRWVKVFGGIFLVVALLFVILMFTRGPGGRGHGPGLHAPSGDTRSQPPSGDGRR